VGYQNSGKTSLVSKILATLNKKALRVGTLKHHGHKGLPLSCDTNKDTFKHRSAGALVTGIEGKGILEITSVDQDYFYLEKLLELFDTLSLDLIIVEGFKNGAFPKIVLLKSPEDEKLLFELSNIVLIICWYDSFQDCNIPWFSINDEKEYILWIQLFVKKSLIAPLS
jgi:molybdopterin-guanine dinucleotide biosynthesis protein B